MSTASLTVKIAADINDFSKSLNAMTKDLDAAAKKVEAVGKSMTIGITLPVVAAGAAMAKMAADAQETSARLDRVFGDAAENMKGAIERMRGSIPETTEALERMAIKTDNMLQGMEMSPGKAAAMSESILQLAGDMSAFAHVPMEDALAALDKGLAGTGRGLKEYGIVLDKNMIQQQAYKMGLLQQGQILTPLGTALASYAIIMQQSSRVQGEAARTAQDASRSFKFFESDVKELAEKAGALLIPAMVTLVDAAKGLVDVLGEMPTGFQIAIGGFIGIAAAIGPLLVIVPQLAKAIETLNAAMEAGGIVGMAVKLGAIGAVAAVVTGIVAALVAEWKFFSNTNPPDDPAFNRALAAAHAHGRTGSGGAGGPTSTFASPFKAFEDMAKNTVTGFNQTLQGGTGVVTSFGQVVQLHERALELLRAQKGAINDEAIEYARVAQETQKIIDRITVANAIATQMRAGDVGAAAHAASVSETPQALIGLQLADRAIQEETRVRMLETQASEASTWSLLTFNDRVRESAANLKIAFADFKTQWSNLGDSLMGGLEAGLTGALAALGPFALAAAAIGKIMQGLQPVLDKLMGPLVALGQIIGDLITPLLQPLFEALKAFGIQVALGGEIMYTVMSALARAIGNIISAIGGMIAKIPFLGGVGHDIQNFGRTILSAADSFSQTARQLDSDRRELQNLNFNDAANGLNALTNAATGAANALTNVPTGYRIALAEYNAMPVVGGGPTPSGSVHSYTFGPGAIVIQAGGANGEQLLDQIVTAARKRATARYGDSTRAAEVFA